MTGQGDDRDRTMDLRRGGDRSRDMVAGRRRFTRLSSRTVDGDLADIDSPESGGVDGDTVARSGHQTSGSGDADDGSDIRAISTGARKFRRLRPDPETAPESSLAGWTAEERGKAGTRPGGGQGDFSGAISADFEDVQVGPIIRRWIMTWEVPLLPSGITIYMEGSEQPYTLVGVRLHAVGTGKCPPYIGMTAQPYGSLVEGPTVPLLTEQDEQGVLIWWVSYVRVQWDAPPLTQAAIHAGQQRAR